MVVVHGNKSRCADTIHDTRTQVAARGRSSRLAVHGLRELSAVRGSRTQIAARGRRSRRVDTVHGAQTQVAARGRRSRHADADRGARTQIAARGHGSRRANAGRGARTQVAARALVAVRGRWSRCARAGRDTWARFTARKRRSRRADAGRGASAGRDTWARFTARGRWARRVDTGRGTRDREKGGLPPDRTVNRRQSPFRGFRQYRASRRMRGGSAGNRLRQRRTNEVVGRRMYFSSDANANFEGLLEVNRRICMPQMAEKTSPDAPPNCAVAP